MTALENSFVMEQQICWAGSDLEGKYPIILTV